MSRSVRPRRSNLQLSGYAGASPPADAPMPNLTSKVSTVTQRPLELILARNLMSALSTPAFLVDEGGLLVFYNEAAGTLLGKRFEELGVVGPEEWGSMFGPFDAEGTPLPYDELPLVVAVRNNRPAHANFEIRSTDGHLHSVEV